MTNKQHLQQNSNNLSGLIPFSLVSNSSQLQEAISQIKKEHLLAIDLEMENNLYHYGSYISIIQISSKTKNWIIDALAIKDLSSLWKIFEDDAIEKIFHDVSFDFRILNSQYSCRPQNIFDSELAAVILGKESVGLQTLLQEYFEVKKESKFQMADWTKRPLKADMLEYAIKDTVYLIPLREKLVAELKEKNRLTWAKESFKNIAQQDYQLKHPGFEDLRGLSQLNPAELGILKQLFELREHLAKKINRPVHYILNNKRLKELSQQPPKTISEWENIRGVHPILKAQAQNFFLAVQKGIKNPVSFQKIKPKKFTQEQKAQLELLTLVRDHLEKKHQLKAHVFLTKDKMVEIILSKSLEPLLSWQQEEVNIALTELHISLDFVN
jgi:ribonuclease D